MLESTQQAVVVRASEPTAAGPMAVTSRHVRALRAAIAGGVGQDGPERVEEIVRRDRGNDSGALCNDIAAVAGAVVIEVWQSGRQLRPSERATFRVLGAVAGRAGLPEGHALEAVRAVLNVLCDVARAQAVLRGGRHDVGVVMTALVQLVEEAQALGEAIADEFRAGVEASVEMAEEAPPVLQAILDGDLVGPDLGILASDAGIDVTIHHGLVLLVGTDTPAAVEASVLRITRQLRHATDTGVVAGPRPHRRLIVPALTRGRWEEARELIGRVATEAGVLALSPIETVPLAGLWELYRDTLHVLDDVVERLGDTTGIVDPLFLDEPDPPGALNGTVSLRPRFVCTEPIPA
jgi:hypothetical protein